MLIHPDVACRRQGLRAMPIKSKEEGRAAVVKVRRQYVEIICVDLVDVELSGWNTGRLDKRDVIPPVVGREAANVEGLERREAAARKERCLCVRY